MLRQKLEKYQLPLFFFLAYLITWSLQIPAYFGAHRLGEKLSNEANFFHFANLFNGSLNPSFTIFFLLFTFSFGPTLAGILVTAYFKGQAGLKDLFGRCLKIKIPWRWVVIIVAIPVALNLASLLIGSVMGGFQPVQYSFLVPLGLVLPFLLYLIIFTGLAEELGWRGYALPELQKRYSAEKASWILGIGWGLWHLPANLLGPYLNGNLALGPTISILLGLTLGIVGWTIVVTWVYNNTQSLFWVIILHGFGNALQSYLILSSNNQPAQFLFGILPWALAILLLKRYGSQTLMLNSQQTRQKNALLQ